MASAGRILIMPKGDYDANSTYENLDLVKHKGTSWLAKKESKGIEPSEANSEYWQDVFEPNIANNLTTVEEGYALDARQGKVLNDKLTKTNGTIIFQNCENAFDATFLVKMNGIVILGFTALLNTEILALTWTTIGQLPSGFYPAVGQRYIAGCIASDSSFAMFSVSSNGMIQIKPPTNIASGKQISFDIVYHVN